MPVVLRSTRRGLDTDVPLTAAVADRAEGASAALVSGPAAARRALKHNGVDRGVRDAARPACSAAAVPAAVPATVLVPVQQPPVHAEDLAEAEQAVVAGELQKALQAAVAQALAAKDETVAEAELPAGDAEMQVGAAKDAEEGAPGNGAHDTAAPVATAAAAMQVVAAPPAAAAAGASPPACAAKRQYTRRVLRYECCTYRMKPADRAAILQCPGATVLDLAPALLQRLRPCLSGMHGVRLRSVFHCVP